jgi:hypothetical protein
MDHKLEDLRAFSPMKLLPSEHCKGQHLIPTEREESLTVRIVEHRRADCVTWASDDAHLDASFNVVGQLRERTAGLPQKRQPRLLGEPAMRCDGL